MNWTVIYFSFFFLSPLLLLLLLLSVFVDIGGNYSNWQMNFQMHTHTQWLTWKSRNFWFAMQHCETNNGNWVFFFVVFALPEKWCRLFYAHILNIVSRSYAIRSHDKRPRFFSLSSGFGNFLLIDIIIGACFRIAIWHVFRKILWISVK